MKTWVLILIVVLGTTAFLGGVTGIVFYAWLGEVMRDLECGGTVGLGSELYKCRMPIYGLIGSAAVVLLGISLIIFGSVKLAKRTRRAEKEHWKKGQ